MRSNSEIAVVGEVPRRVPLGLCRILAGTKGGSVKMRDGVLGKRAQMVDQELGNRNNDAMAAWNAILMSQAIFRRLRVGKNVMWCCYDEVGDAKFKRLKLTWEEAGLH